MSSGRRISWAVPYLLTVCRPLGGSSVLTDLLLTLVLNLEKEEPAQIDKRHGCSDYGAQTSVAGTNVTFLEGLDLVCLKQNQFYT